MQVADWKAWLQDPVTVALRAYLRQMQRPGLSTYREGRPVDPVQQGEVKAFHRLEQALTIRNADATCTAFENALKEEQKS